MSLTIIYSYTIIKKIQKLEGDKMRISKDPEVRKQEMIDTAMKLFSKKGYEFTSMSDIAKEMNVVSGLCYRYFKSKEELYKTAVHIYAKECSAPIIDILSKDYDSIDECMKVFSEHFINTDGKEKYHDFFHGNNNEFFHRQLESIMLKNIEPYLTSLLDKWKEKKLVHINNSEYAAKFILYGQMPIINDDKIPSAEKAEITKQFILKILL